MKKPKILYLSCHTILEYDEIRMFRDMDCELFIIGAYFTPDKPHINSRPPLLSCKMVTEAFPIYHKMYEENKRAGISPDWCGKLLSKEFVDCFDIIIVMHIPDWITKNWNVLKGRTVIWRTIGQSIPSTENSLKQCRAEGLKIIRYSPMERTIPDYIGEDELIRFGKYKEDFLPWTGELEKAVTIGQAMKKRGSFCNYDLYMEVTKDIPSQLYGYGNENNEIESYQELVNILSKNRVYFYTGTKPASYTLNFIEAAMAGIPIVSIGKQSALFEGHDYFEVATLLEKYHSGFSSDDATELKTHIQNLLTDRKSANNTSQCLLQMASELFDAEKIKPQWESFFSNL